MLEKVLLLPSQPLKKYAQYVTGINVTWWLPIFNSRVNRNLPDMSTKEDKLCCFVSLSVMFSGNFKAESDRTVFFQCQRSN